MSTEVIPHCPNEYNKFKNLKKNSKVQFKYNDEEEYKSATLLSRSGKVTGKYNNAWNVRLNDADETVKSIDFERDVSSLKLIPTEVASQNNTEEVLYSQVFLTELENQTFKAKLLELESWQKQNVYVAEDDIGQNCISVRWVISKKIVNGEHITKARLCARGFEEIQDFPTDSPCCSRIGLRSVISIISTKQWIIKSIDVKTAFLQGK